jgi:hypothetical protein
VKAVVDTNVLISGVFFGGVPRHVLDAWADGRFELLLSPSIFDEYLRTCDRLGAAHPGLEYRELLAASSGMARWWPIRASLHRSPSTPMTTSSWPAHGRVAALPLLDGPRPADLPALGYMSPLPGETDGRV